MIKNYNCSMVGKVMVSNRFKEWVYLGLYSCLIFFSMIALLRTLTWLTAGWGSIERKDLYLAMEGVYWFKPLQKYYLFGLPPLVTGMFMLFVSMFVGYVTLWLVKKWKWRNLVLVGLVLVLGWAHLGGLVCRPCFTSGPCPEICVRVPKVWVVFYRATGVRIGF